MQNVSDSPPLVSKRSQTFFFSQAVFPAFGEETQLGLWLFGAEAGFPPLAFPPKSKEVENPQSNKGNQLDMSSVRLSKPAS